MVVPRAQPNVGNKHNPHVLRADEQPREMMRHPPASEKKRQRKIGCERGRERKRERDPQRERTRERKKSKDEERERER